MTFTMTLQTHILGNRHKADSLGDVDVPVSNDAIFIEGEMPSPTR